METPVQPHFDQLLEQAALIVEDVSDEIMECESLRAWEGAVCPMIFALYSGAATALIRSAGDSME